MRPNQDVATVGIPMHCNSSAPAINLKLYVNHLARFQFQL